MWGVLSGQELSAPREWNQRLTASVKGAVGMAILVLECVCYSLSLQYRDRT